MATYAPIGGVVQLGAVHTWHSAPHYSAALNSVVRPIGWGPFEVFEPKYLEQIYRGRPGNFRYRIAHAQISPSLHVKFTENVEGESIYTEFLLSRGEGMHNLGFMVDEIDARIAAMRQLGIGVLQSGKRPGRSFAYMDTESLLGTIIEYRERAA